MILKLIGRKPDWTSVSIFIFVLRQNAMNNRYPSTYVKDTKTNTSGLKRFFFFGYSKYFSTSEKYLTALPNMQNKLLQDMATYFNTLSF